MSDAPTPVELLTLPDVVSVQPITHAKVTVVTFRDGAQDFHAQATPEPPPHMEMVAELLALREATKTVIATLETLGTVNGDNQDRATRAALEGVIATLRV